MKALLNLNGLEKMFCIVDMHIRYRMNLISDFILLGRVQLDYNRCILAFIAQ